MILKSLLRDYKLTAFSSHEHNPNMLMRNIRRKGLTISWPERDNTESIAIIPTSLAIANFEQEEMEIIFCAEVKR